MPEVMEATTELYTHIKQIQGVLDSMANDFRNHFDSVPNTTVPLTQLLSSQGVSTID